MQQAKYQVRFEWGEAGVRRVAAGAHVIVVADELDGHGRASSGQRAEAIAVAAAADAVAAAAGADADAPAVLCATEASARDVASRILELQTALGDRAVVAVIAAGSVDDDGFRMAVEDQLAAGAVVDALAAVGIDFASPEAASACASWQGLQRATAHLLTASVSGAALVDARSQRDAHGSECIVLREFSPRA